MYTVDYCCNSHSRHFGVNTTIEITYKQQEIILFCADANKTECRSFKRLVQKWDWYQPNITKPEQNFLHKQISTTVQRNVDSRMKKNRIVRKKGASGGRLAFYFLCVFVEFYTVFRTKNVLLFDLSFGYHNVFIGMVHSEWKLYFWEDKDFIQLWMETYFCGIRNQVIFPKIPKKGFILIWNFLD